MTRPESRFVMVVAIALAFAVSACGSRVPPSAIGDYSAMHLADSPERRLDLLVGKDQRVARIAWSLAVANADLCPANRLRVGWTLHSASQYGPALRSLAERRFGFVGDLPGVLAAPAGSGAALAGLDTGDVILSVNDRLLDPGGPVSRRSYDGLQANISQLDQAAQQGPLQLKVRRGGRDRDVVVNPLMACAYVTQIEVRDDLRSLSDGRTVFISDKLVDLTADDDQLAFILAHELAHAVLEHRTVSDVSGQRGALNALITLDRNGGSRSETDADIMGLYLLARAGFDPDRAVQFLSVYERNTPLSGFPQISLSGGIYPSLAARRTALAPVLLDIQARRSSGRRLIP